MRKRSLFSAGVMLLFCMFFCAVSVSFAYNLEEVQKKIKEKGLKWVAEDVPGAENRRLGLLRHDYTVAVEPAPFQEEVSATSLTSLDWRNVGDNLLGVQYGDYVTPVKDQGNCGSCWAFATTTTLESTTLISQNTPYDPAAGTDINLSEQEMLSCSQAGSCNGGYIEEASDYISVNYNTGCSWCSHTPYNMGLPTEACYPYTMSSTCAALGTCGNNRYKIDTWYGVPVTSADDIKSALNIYGPLVVTFAVYSDFYYNYVSGIYEAVSCDKSQNKLVGYHAVSVVGYDDNTGSTPYFIVKNSWGSTWGKEAGYFRIGYTQVTNCVGFGATTLAYSKTACNGSITVTSPTSSDTWQAGTSHAITWNATGSIGQYVKIDLNQGSTFIKTIQSSTPVVDGSYTWLVDSNLQGTNYVIVVTSTTCGSATGASGYFTIGAAQNFNASGLVTSGSSALSGVNMTFSRVSGTGYVPAAVSTDDSSNLNWSQSGFQDGTTYRVTPSKSGTTFTPVYRDFSFGSSSGLNFTAIENKITAVISPIVGSWKRGTTLPIQWTYTWNPGSYSYVKIELMSGTRVKTISSRAKIGTNGIGYYNWRIPTTQATGTYQIRVTSTTNGSSATGASFTIY